MPEQFELVGVVDLSTELLNTVLEEFALPESLGYTSYDEALERTACEGGRDRHLGARSRATG